MRRVSLANGPTSTRLKLPFQGDGRLASEPMGSGAVTGAPSVVARAEARDPNRVETSRFSLDRTRPSLPPSLPALPPSSIIVHHTAVPRPSFRVCPSPRSSHSPCKTRITPDENMPSIQQSLQSLAKRDFDQTTGTSAQKNWAYRNRKYHRPWCIPSVSCRNRC